VSISNKSLIQITNALSEKFADYVNENLQDELYDLLLEAAAKFIPEVLGELDPDLECDLAGDLVGSIIFKPVEEKVLPPTYVWDNTLHNL
jgi:hypothetical protein